MVVAQPTQIDTTGQTQIDTTGQTGTAKQSLALSEQERLLVEKRTGAPLGQWPDESSSPENSPVITSELS